MNAPINPVSLGNTALNKIRGMSTTQRWIAGGVASAGLAAVGTLLRNRGDRNDPVARDRHRRSDNAAVMSTLY